MNLWEQEAKEKWGHTPAYKEYEEKQPTGQAQAAGMDAIMAEFAACMTAGAKPEADQAQSLVAALQSYITENFYHCTKEILVCLGQMYVADARFRENIDKHAAGTAAFIRDAITAYCK